MTAEEQRYMEFFKRMQTQAAGQLGDLGGLAQGDLSKLGPTGADQELAAQAIMRTREIAQRELEAASGEMQAQLGEQLASRGMQGASIEAVQRGMLTRSMQQELAKMLLASQQQQGEALMNLPFRRAEVALGANQALFNQIAGMSQMPYQGLLNARLAQTTKTSSQTMSPLQQAQAMAQIGGSIMSGGMSMPKLPGVGGVPGQSSNPQVSGFSSDLKYDWLKQ